MGGIFLSYRREDTGGYSGRLADALRDNFGEDVIFRDVDTISPGHDFVDAITAAVEEADIFLAVIGPRWLTAKDQARRRRIDDPEDYVRLEITAALGRAKKVIPLLVDGARLPRPQDVPEPLRPLLRRQAIELTDSRWSYDLGVLLDELRPALLREETKPVPADTAPRQAARRLPRRRLGVLGLLSALLAVGLVAGLLQTRHHSPMVAAAAPDGPATSAPSVPGPSASSPTGLTAAPDGCTTVDVAASPEKYDLLNDLATTFNSSKEATSGVCAFVQVRKVSSGAAMQLLADGWAGEAANGPRPVVWSPAASSWGAILNEKLRQKGEPAMAPPAKPFMVTPLVIAMPRPMAESLGWPNTPIGYADILKLAQDPSGWGAKGHPEWGRFRLGKTNPNFSTSGLSATIAQYYAATGKTSGLTGEDLARPEVDAFARAVESSIVHYGDTTLTFLNNWYRSDARGTALTYTSAVAVEEKSLIDYNRGNPDGILDQGEQPRPPKVPLVAIYPKEGTLFSDSPYYVLDAPWVDAKQKAAARTFEAYAQQPDKQRRVLEFGFRPGNAQVQVSSPIERANGVDPGQPKNVLGVPDPAVLVRILDQWGQQRKAARVMLVMDVSGSMGDIADTSGRTKLDLAQQAATNALAQFKGDDLVSLRIFSTGISPRSPTDYADIVPFGPISSNREVLAQRIRSLVPSRDTPLYTVAGDSYAQMRDSYDADRINAVVLLTDGKNEDPRNDNLDALLASLHSGGEGQASRPVRVFTIAYGVDADITTLERIAHATNAAAYNAKDPASIDKVFTSVVSNF
ncbi:MAG: substrate-binding domain-containing protein [Acidimicrobiales bacterium]